MITKEEWSRIENVLTGAFGRVELLIDGFNVTLNIERVRNLKYGIMTYVNGEFRGAWMMEDSEIGAKFYRPNTRFINNSKLRAELIKIWGGKRCPKHRLEEINKKITLHDPVWNCAKKMRCHLVKHNTDISIIKIGY